MKKIDRMENVYHANSNHKEALVPIVVSVKIDFKAKNQKLLQTNKDNLKL